MREILLGVTRVSRNPFGSYYENMHGILKKGCSIIKSRNNVLIHSVRPSHDVMSVFLDLAFLDVMLLNPDSDRLTLGTGTSDVFRLD